MPATPDEDLQDPQQWDVETAETRPPVRKSRAVVSVAFSREDFEHLAEVAESLGMKTSELIRAATFELLRARERVAFFHAAPATTEARWSHLPEPERMNESANSAHLQAV